MKQTVLKINIYKKYTHKNWQKWYLFREKWHPFYTIFFGSFPENFGKKWQKNVQNFVKSASFYEKNSCTICVIFLKKSAIFVNFLYIYFYKYLLLELFGSFFTRYLFPVLKRFFCKVLVSPASREAPG